MVFDMAAFAVLARPLRTAIEAARSSDPLRVPAFGAPYPKPAKKTAVGKRAAPVRAQRAAASGA
jgi:hypothetical protein